MTALRLLLLTTVALGWTSVDAATAPWARADELVSSRWAEGVQWESQPVRAGVAPTDVSASPPYVQRNGTDVRGRIAVTAAQGAAFFLRPLEVVRIQSDGELRFVRVPVNDRPGASTLRVEERAIAAKRGLFYVAEPIGDGAVWVVTSARTDQSTSTSGVDVLVERPQAIDAPLGAEAVRAALRACIDGARACPTLPQYPAVSAELAVGEALQAELLVHEPALVDAARDYRKAAAVRALSLVEPLNPTTFAVRAAQLPGAEEQLSELPGSDPYFLQAGDRGAHTVTVEGPGVLVVGARGLAHGNRNAVVTLKDGDRVLGRMTLPLAASFVGEDATSVLPKVRTPRRTSSGAPLALAEELRVVLGPGVHRYTVQWEGGVVLLRSQQAQRRPFLGELFDGSADLESLTARGLQRLEGQQSVHAALLRHELLALSGDAPEVSAKAGVGSDPLAPPDTGSAKPGVGSDLLSALGAVQKLERSASASLSAESLARLHALSSSSALAWRLRLRAAAARPQSAAELLQRPRAVPDNGGLLFDYAQALAFAVPTGAEVQTLAALELAWRHSPLADNVRRRYRAVFHDSTRWSPLKGRGGAPTSTPRWLDIERVDASSQPSARALTAVTSGRPGRFVAAKGATLSAFVLQGAAEQPVTIRVDGERFTINAIASVERLDVAVPEGLHDVTVEGNGRLFVALPSHGPASDAAVDRAFVRSAYPVRREATGDQRSGRITFTRPSLNSPLPLRISLRANTTPSTAPVLVVMRTDVGTAHRLWLAPSAATEAQLRLGEAGAAASSPIAHAVVMLPPLTSEVWFETADDVQVFAAASTRAASEDASELSTPPLPAASEQELPRLVELSRLLRSTTVQRPELLLQRAELLLRFGEGLLARADLSSLLAREPELTAAQARKLGVLVEQLAIATEERSAMQVSRPVLLQPGYAATSPQGADRTAALAARARQGNADAALSELSAPTTPSERWLRARLLLALGRPEEALAALVALHAETTASSAASYVARDAVDAFGQCALQSDGFATFAPFVAPLSVEASKTEPLRASRRFVSLAERATRWEPLSAAEQGAGVELIKSARTDEPLRSKVRKALVAPRFDPADAHFIRVGDSSVLQLRSEADRVLGVDLDCAGPPIAARSADCDVAIRIDGKALQTRRVKLWTAETIELPKLSRGTHQVEVSINEGGVALARFFAAASSAMDSDQTALDAAKPTAFQRALPGKPVAFTVLGPSVVRLLAAAPDGQKGKDVTASVSSPTGVIQTAVLGDTAQARDEGHFIVLSEAGPHRVALSAEAGEALVRAELGRGDRAVEQVSDSRLTVSELQSRAELLSVPAAPPPLSLLPGEAAAFGSGDDGFGTLSGELSFRQELVPEDERPSRPLTTGMEARFALRKRLLGRSAFLRLQPTVRVPVGRSPVTGGQLSLFARGLPLGARASLSAGALTQQLGALWRSSFAAHVALDRSFELSPNLRLIPGVGFTALGFSQLDAAAEAQVDRSIYTRFARDHARRLTPSVALRWQPLQDQVGRLSARTMTNADFASVDHWTTNARWTALLGGPLRLMRLGLGYELSNRLADAHRSQTYLRHAVEVGVDRSVWAFGQGRLLMFAENRLEVSSPYGNQNLFSLGVRWDWTGGRGLSDLMPSEEEFDQHLESGRFAD